MEGLWGDFSSSKQLDCPWKLTSVDCPAQFVFVTNDTFTGDLNGICGADNICQQAADYAGLAGIYKAGLSDDINSPAVRFVKHHTPYIRVDGEISGSRVNA